MKDRNIKQADYLVVTPSELYRIAREVHEETQPPRKERAWWVDWFIFLVAIMWLILYYLLSLKNDNHEERYRIHAERIRAWESQIIELNEEFCNLRDDWSECPWEDE